MNPRPVPGVILALDPGDDAACTKAALAAHEPAAGRITVHPTPGTTRADDLAHDILAALGKPYTPPGPWSRAHGALHAAAAAWILTTSVHHLRPPPPSTTSLSCEPTSSPRPSGASCWTCSNIPAST